MTLEELQRLHDAATKAPWTWRDKHEGGVCGDGKEYANVMYFGEQGHGYDGDTKGEAPSTEDRELMLAARNALPKLIAVAKAARRVASMPLDGISDAVRNGLYYEAVTSLTKALAEMEKA